ncbi:glycerate kinase [Staphylococcus massiliensis]|uniref:Glycerate kinase n=1 Tax=Staphylococcus massiliensis S46 TaxID=1229783 RepID=K9AMJ7_9STAP|nr:glycerate kinase [Staphylococcus massiliensis]EKU48524.1 glycerate kinase [Staphylococcus massiliensis S46]MCG3400077.1 glycerate kinase [Staphylococcus massiliensis]MCG3401800.1 glycerate kinase [Staphylococcus massiliensis]MCG3412672.1 glycerate kinase [Staphylococcus massiliensis]POA01533.1 glycerate kinase [Staphylococcus massiliensis CCUG 55927]
MKVLVAMDEFYGSLTSYEANRYVEEAVASQIKEADIVQVPLFNGKNELLTSVFSWQSGTKYKLETHDADMNHVQTEYGITNDGYTVIESQLFLKGENPVTHRSSYGLGEVILHALENGAKHFIISVGGIDSYDGGAGLLQALGATFYDDDGHVIDLSKGPRYLNLVRRIDTSHLNDKLTQATIEIVSDFDSHYYGKQSAIMKTYEHKGISKEDAIEVDNKVWYLNEILKSSLNLTLSPIERGGAGGGVAAVLSGIYGGTISTSHAILDKITHLDQLIEQADLVIFGEGIDEDSQILETTSLKIAELCQKHHKTNVAICGTSNKFDAFTERDVTGMFNVFMDAPTTFTNYQLGIQLRQYSIQSLKLLQASIS